jgi:hypothetical protein
MNIYFSRKFESKIVLRRISCRWKDKIKIDLKGLYGSATAGFGDCYDHKYGLGVL